MKEKLINAFKELWSDVISEDNNSIDNAETEIEGVQNLQNYKIMCEKPTPLGVGWIAQDI